MAHRLLKILTATLMLSALSPAYSALEDQEGAYELGISEVQLPLSGAGQVVLRRCADCDPEMLRVNGSTRYLVGFGTSGVSLADFRAATSSMSSGAPIFVFFDTETGVVNRLVVNPSN